MLVLLLPLCIQGSCICLFLPPLVKTPNESLPIIFHSPHVNKSHLMCAFCNHNHNFIAMLVLFLFRFVYYLFVCYLLWWFLTDSDTVFARRQAGWRPKIDFRMLAKTSGKYIQIFEATKDNAICVGAYWNRRLCPPSSSSQTFPLRHFSLSFSQQRRQSNDSDNDNPTTAPPTTLFNNINSLQK